MEYTLTAHNGLNLASQSSLPNLTQHDASESGLHFTESVKIIEALAGRLACVKCDKMPKAKVFTLGHCHHKYCEKCIKVEAGKACVICGERGFPKDAKPDLFSTSLLASIPKTYSVLKDLQDIGSEKEGSPNRSPPKLVTQTKILEVEKKEAENEEEEELFVSTFDMANIAKPQVEIQHKSQIVAEGENQAAVVVDPIDIYEYNECTPAAQILPSSPDILEETPQHKPKIPTVTVAKKLNTSVKELDLPQAKETPSVEEATKMHPEKLTESEKPIITRSKTVTPFPKPAELLDPSDEELFQQSCQSDSDDRSSRGLPGIPGLPILTPHDILEQCTRVTTEKFMEGLKKGVAKLNREAGAKKPVSDRSSGEHDPPALTPHEKPETPKTEKDSANVIPRLAGNRRRKTSTESLGQIKVGTKKKSTSEAPVSKATKARPYPPPRRRRSTATSDTATSSPSLNTLMDTTADDDTKSVTTSTSKARKRRASTSSLKKVLVSCPSPNSSLNDSFLRSTKEKKNSKGETGLHIACRAGHVEKVKNYLEAGFSIDAKDHAGWSPLHEVVNSKKASFDSKLEVIKILLENNCNVNAVGGPEEETALHSAVLLGMEKIVELLLNSGASPNIRNREGQLPIDVAFNDLIISLLDEKMKKSRASDGAANNVSNTEGSTTSNYHSAVATFEEDDPAVLQVMVSKAVVYFNFDVSQEDVEDTRKILKMRVVDQLTYAKANVTHIVHKFEHQDQRAVPISLEYLFGLAHGMWQLNYEWITESLKALECLCPTTFEVIGHLGNENSETSKVPILSRANHDKGNPGLFDGFNFYLYKTCGYARDLVDLPKKDLCTLLTAASGKIINREPNPGEVNPLEYPRRFHAQQQDHSTPSKFDLTTHVILYDDKAPPPAKKKFIMEHVKTLKTSWVVQSLLQFRLEDPENHL